MTAGAPAHLPGSCHLDLAHTSPSRPKSRSEPSFRGLSEGKSKPELLPHVEPSISGPFHSHLSFPPPFPRSFLLSLLTVPQALLFIVFTNLASRIPDIPNTHASPVRPAAGSLLQHQAESIRRPNRRNNFPQSARILQRLEHETGNRIQKCETLNLLDPSQFTPFFYCPSLARYVSIPG